MPEEKELSKKLEKSCFFCHLPTDLGETRGIMEIQTEVSYTFQEEEDFKKNHPHSRLENFKKTEYKCGLGMNCALPELYKHMKNQEKRNGIYDSNHARMA